MSAPRDLAEFAAQAPNKCPELGMLAAHSPVDYPPEMARGSTPVPALYRVSVTRKGESLTYEAHVCRHCGLMYVEVSHVATGI